MLERFSIRQVVMGVMTLLMLLALGGLLVMLLAASRTGSALEVEFEQLMEDQAIAERIVYHTQAQLAAARRYNDTGDRAYLDEFRVRGTAVYDEIRRYLFRDLDSDERHLVESLRERHESIEVSAQRLFAEPASGSFGQLAEVDTLNMQLDSLLELRRASSLAMYEHQRREWQWLYAISAALVLAFVIALVAAAAFLRSRLIEPLTALSSAVRGVGAGDFDLRVEPLGNDELADVARSFNRMAERLHAARRDAADAERGLRASEERYHSLFDRVPVALYRTTPDGQLLDGNTALLQLLGYRDADEMLGLNAADVYLEGDDRSRWRRMLDNAIGTVEVDRQLTRHDGTVIWVRDTARAVRDADGSTLYYEGALQDVTESVRAAQAVRRSEARFRSLIENASDGVLILSGSGVILYQSPAVERILGHAPSETVGRARFDLIHPDDVDAVRGAYVDLSTRPGGARSIEFRCLHRDGDWRMLHAIGTNLLDDTAVGGFVINMIDTTVRHQLEQQLQHAHKMEAVGRLAGGIAHDFNNLLTAIQGYTDLLSESHATDDRARRDLVEIRRAVDSAARLTRQLLAFSRRQVVRPRPTDVGAVVRELDQMLRRLITADVTLRASAKADCWVSIDPGQLEQIVVNLVVNARDAAPKTGITVAVDTVRVEHGEDADAPGLQADDYVVVSVTDDGHGIGSDVLPYIFDPFFTTKDIGQGTGLGLATVYGIVGESGGRVYARSDDASGTVMRVFLPRVPRPAHTATSEASAAALVTGTETILLVEDEAAVRSLAERVLTRHGYAVMSAANGVEALALARTAEGGIDLLLTDVVMPGMGGVQLATRLLAEMPELQVLFISGYAADVVPVTAEDGRTLHFLEKPFSPASLGEAVRSVLDARTALR